MDGSVFSSAHGAVDSVIGRLTSLLVSEAQLLAGVRGDVEFISDEMGSMNGFVLHVSEAEYPDHQVRAWMKQVRDLAYSSQDCVDLYVQHLSAGGSPGSGLWAYLRRLPWLLRTMPVRHQLALRIRELKVRAQEVGDRRHRYGVTVPAANTKHAPAAVAGGTLAPRPAGEEDLRRLALVDGPPADAERDVYQLVEWLREESGDDHNGPRVILIVGGPGTGKTTLANKLRAHSYVQSCFDGKLFLRGKDVDIRDELFYMIRSQLCGYDLHVVSELEKSRYDIVRDLHRHQLVGKRYVVVADDVDPDVYDELMRTLCSETFRFAGAGGAVILTAYGESLVDSFRYPYKIFPILNFRSAPHFFFERAAGLVGSKSHLMRPLGDILEKCYPDAFTINMFLRLLYANPDRTQKELLAISSNLEDHFTSKNADTMLLLCYNDLPGHYRSALLYLAVFPQGTSFRRATLVRRWVIEGLVTQGGQLDAGHQAERCFDELLHRGFLSPVGILVAGKAKTCTVHPMVHEFITGIARSVHFMDGGLPPELACRFSIRNRIGLEASRPNLTSGPGGSASAMVALLESLQTSSQWQVLRLLDLEGCTGLTKRHLKIICEIILLKYLSLRNTDVTELPKEILNLRCLETLDIRQTKVRAFATKHVTLPMLKHLLAGNKEPPRENSGGFEGPFVTVRLPSGIRRMKNLEELCHVDVSNNNINDLTDISQLLQLKKLGVVLQGKKYRLTFLFQQIDKLYACLRSLSIRIDQQTAGEEITTDTEGVAISPPKLLESLHINGIIAGFPNWIAGLHKLAKIKLSNTLLGEDAISLIENLPLLQYLRLRNVSFTESELTFSKDKFQSLVSLVVEGTSITSIVFDNGAAPKIERIAWSFTSMTSLCGIQHLQKLKEVELNGDCDLGHVENAIKEHPNHPSLKHKRQNKPAQAAAAP